MLTEATWPSSARHGFRNFSWTQEAMKEWDEVWAALWRVGVKWEWQNGDWYARRYGDVYKKYVVHNDAIRLEMTVPLPGRDIILGMHEHLLDLATDDPHVDHATNLIRKWTQKYD